VAAALPGDKIVMAAGTYNMTGYLTISRDGTQANPIQLVGPRTAILDFGGVNNFRFLQFGDYDGGSVHGADWWIVAGFSHRRSFFGPSLWNSNHNVLCDLLVEDVGQEGINIKGPLGSSDNIVRDSVVRNTGQVAYYYGEAFYIGNGATKDSPSNRNRILRNHIGPNVTAEHIDIKIGTSGNYVEGNVSDATGYRWTDGSNPAGQFTTGVFIASGSDQTFVNNTITNLNATEAFAFQIWQGTRVIFHGNRVTGTFRYGFQMNPIGQGNVVGCDNTVTGGTFANVSCQ
jgi:hypothetical protein